jgi:RNA polymerase sigma-70 factor (ECF subfamily)
MAPDLTLTFDALAGTAGEAAAEPLSMDDQEFRIFYTRTAQPLRSYLRHLSGDPALADDLLQESYLRLLRARLPEMTDAYRKNYLYKIATNLMRDHLRSPRNATLPLLEEREIPAPAGSAAPGEESLMRADLSEAMLSLKPRERQMLWLAYVEGSSHQEIAEMTGMKTQSIRPLLFRARQKLAGLLRKRGFAPAEA